METSTRQRNDCSCGKRTRLAMAASSRASRLDKWGKEQVYRAQINKHANIFTQTQHIKHNVQTQTHTFFCPPLKMDTITFSSEFKQFDGKRISRKVRKN